MAKITAMFREGGLLVPQYVAEEEMKKSRYHDMLRRDIRPFVSISICRTLEDMETRAREREIDLEMEKKRKSDQVQGSEGLVKRPKVFDSRSKGQQGRAAVASASCHMMELAGEVVQTATSVARLVILAGIVSMYRI